MFLNFCQSPTEGDERMPHKAAQRRSMKKKHFSFEVSICLGFRDM